MAYLIDDILERATRVHTQITWNDGAKPITRTGWFLSRPLGKPLLDRIADAWLVLWGQAEAVIFAEQTGSK